MPPISLKRRLQLGHSITTTINPSQTASLFGLDGMGAIVSHLDRLALDNKRDASNQRHDEWISPFENIDLTIDRIPVATLVLLDQCQKDSKESNRTKRDRDRWPVWSGSFSNERNRDYGHEELKWHIFCYVICTDRMIDFPDELEEHKHHTRREFGVCVGSLNKVFRDWDRFPFRRYNIYNNLNTEPLTIRSLLGEYVPPERPPLNPKFYTTTQKFRHLQREIRIEFDDCDFHDDSFDRRKKPTFSRENRNKEARDWRVRTAKPKFHKRLSLMGLPAEIRLLILENIFKDLEIDAWGDIPILRARYGPWQPAANPLAILLACKELYFEGNKIFQQQTTFRTRLIPAADCLGWDEDDVQTLLPNVKKLEIKICNPEYYLKDTRRIIWVHGWYKHELDDLMQNQAKEAFKRNNQLQRLTVRLEKGKKASTTMSDFFIKKHAVDSLMAWMGKVKVLRIQGEIPEELKEYARNMEILVQGYDDTPPPVVVEEVEEEGEDVEKQ